MYIRVNLPKFYDMRTSGPFIELVLSLLKNLDMNSQNKLPTPMSLFAKIENPARSRVIPFRYG